MIHTAERYDSIADLAGKLSDIVKEIKINEEWRDFARDISDCSGYKEACTEINMLKSKAECFNAILLEMIRSQSWIGSL